MTDDLRVDIPVYRRTGEGGAEVVLYAVEVSRGEQGWTLEKRYSELERLHAQLREQHGTLPAFPAKSLFALRRPEELEARRRALAAYLIALAARADVAHGPLLAGFLELERAGPPRAEPLTLVAQREEGALGYRDLLFAEEARWLAVLRSDPSAVSRADSYLTNCRLPWERGTREPVFAVGALELCGLSTARELALPVLAQMAFAAQPLCLAHEPSRGLLAVGCDDGSLKLFRAGKRGAPACELLGDEKAHEGRVVRVAFAPGQRVLLSVGGDGRVRSSDAVEGLPGRGELSSVRGGTRAVQRGAARWAEAAGRRRGRRAAPLRRAAQPCAARGRARARRRSAARTGAVPRGRRHAGVRRVAGRGQHPLHGCGDAAR